MVSFFAVACCRVVRVALALRALFLWQKLINLRFVSIFSRSTTKSTVYSLGVMYSKCSPEILLSRLSSLRGFVSDTFYTLIFFTFSSGEFFSPFFSFFFLKMKEEDWGNFCLNTNEATFLSLNQKKSKECFNH